MMERLTRNRPLAMVLAVIFAFSLLALLSNLTPNHSLLNNSSQGVTEEIAVESSSSQPHLITDDQQQVKEEAQEEEGLDKPEDEDSVEITVKPPVNSKNWKPKKWGRLSDEVELAISNNIRETKKDRILLTAIANQGMADYTLNWIASLKKTKLDDKFLVFAIDEEMVETMKLHGYGDHVVLIPKSWFHKELSGEFEAWLSDGYTPITHSKSLVVERLLYTGVTVWFSDVDIVFTSPFIYNYLVMKLGSRRPTEVLFSQETEQNIVNSGFYIMRPTDTNKRILEASIYIQDTEVNEFGVTQQRAMNRVLNELNLNYQTSSIALLDLALFPHGGMYFDRDIPTKYGMTPMMVHANYRKGEQKKLDLQAHGLWYI